MSKKVMLDPGDLVAYASFADAIISSSDNKVEHFGGAVSVSAFQRRKETIVSIQQRDARELARCVTWSQES